MLEANRDEALRCLEISHKFHAEEEYELAVKYAKKSLHLYVTEEAQKWLNQAEVALMYYKTKAKSAPFSTEKTKTEQVDDSNYKKSTNSKDKYSSTLSYTSEQVQQVKKLFQVDKNDFYGILGLKRPADDAEIKRAYRKLALQFHPDKNHAPGADEAFKLVSRAFSCLSDPAKREQYDRFGVPEEGMSSSGGMNRAGARFRGPTNFFESELSPEDLFNLFFGGVANNPAAGGFQFPTGGPFGPMFVQTFNGPFGGATRGGHPFFRRAQAQRPPQTWLTWFLQLFPFIVLTLLALLSNWMNSMGQSDDTTWNKVSRHVSLSTNSNFPHAFVTQNLQIPYYGSNEYQRYFSNMHMSRSLMVEMKTFEDSIERRYVADLQSKCRTEERRLQERRAAAARDSAMLEKLKDEKSPSCEKLVSLGIKPTPNS